MPTARKLVPPPPDDIPAADFPLLTDADPLGFEKAQASVPRHRRIFYFLAADLAEHVAARLEELGHNARWLARKLGKTDSEISRWLGGTHNLTLESVAKLSDALEEDLLVSPRFPMGYFGPVPVVPVVATHFTTSSALDWRGGSYMPTTLPRSARLTLTADDYTFARAA